MASAISKLAGASGGSGGGGGGGGAAGKAGGALGKTFETLGAGAGMITGVFSTIMKPALMAVSFGMQNLVKVGQTLVTNQLALADGAIAGTNSLASLTAGLESLPLGLGFVMKAYNFQIKKMEATIKTFDDISSVGARFGGSLDEIRSSARGMGLGLDEFAKTMKEAGPQLRFMGTTSEEGARNLVKFNTTMIKGEVGKGLLGLGYSLQEANGMVANYSEAIGGLKAEQLKDQRAMEKSVKFFAEELDAAAQLEGKTRQEKLDQLKKDNQNSAVQAALSEMNDEQVKKYNLAMLNAKSQGEKEYIQSLMLGLPPMTKASQQYAAMNAKAAAASADQVDAIKSGLTVEQEKKRILDNSNKVMIAQSEQYKAFGTTGKALAFSGGALKDSMGAMADAAKEAKNTGLDTEKKLADRREKIYDQQKKVEESSIGDKKRQIAAAKFAGEDLMDALYKAFKPLIDIILLLNQKFIEALPAIGLFVGDVVKKGMGVLTSIFKAIDWNAVKTSFMGAWKMLTETFGNIYDAVSKAMGGGSGIGAFLQKGMTMFFETMKGVVEAVGIIVVKFAQSGLFQSLKQFMLNMWDLIAALVDTVVAIVKSPVGQVVIETIFGIFETLFDIVNALIKATIGVVKFIGDVYKFMSQDFATAWQKIKEWAGKILDSVIDWFKSIPKKITDFFGEGSIMTRIIEGIESIIGSIVNGIKAIGSKIVNFFKSSDAAPTAPTAPQTASAPNGSNMPPMTETARKMAEENAKKNAPTVTANNNGNVPVVQPKSNDPTEILRAEIQTLNNITSEMLKAIRDTRDYSKSTANTLASNGNLFKRG
jgi:hypothetical protein